MVTSGKPASCLILFKLSVVLTDRLMVDGRGPVSSSRVVSTGVSASAKDDVTWVARLLILLCGSNISVAMLASDGSLSGSSVLE